MNPSFTLVALHPALFVDLVVLLLEECALPNGHVGQLNRVALFEFGVAKMTPVVLIIAADVVVAIPSDSFGRTLEAVAVEDRRFEEKLLAAAKSAGITTETLGLLLLLQLIDQLIVVRDELGPHFLRHIVNDGTVGIVQHGIVEGKENVGLETLNGIVAAVLQALLDRTEVHGPLDNLEVVGQTKLDRINGSIEDPAMLVSHENPQEVSGLELELLRRQLEAIIQRLDMSLDLLDREAVDESVILLRLGTSMLRHDHLTIGVGNAGRRADSMCQAAVVLVSRLPGGARRPCQWLMVLLTVTLLGANGTGDSTSARPPSFRAGSLLIRRIHLLLSHRLPSLLLAADLHRLHLLLLLVTAVDCFPDRTADGAPDILTSMVVTQDVPGTDAVRHQALLIFALGDMLPQSLHAGAVRGHRAPTILMGTLGGVAE